MNDDTTTEIHQDEQATTRDETAEWNDTVVLERRPGGRHPVNVGHLVMGLAFAGLAVLWAMFEAEAIVGSDLRWLVPLPWLAAGLGGLIALAVSGRRRSS